LAQKTAGINSTFPTRTSHIKMCNQISRNLIARASLLRNCNWRVWRKTNEQAPFPALLPHPDQNSSSETPSMYIDLPHLVGEITIARAQGTHRGIFIYVLPPSTICTRLSWKLCSRAAHKTGLMTPGSIPLSTRWI